MNAAGEKIILGIETTCDETSAAVVADGRRVISNVIASQVDIHRIYGGVVPEIAARKHMESISFTVSEALRQAEMTLQQIDGVAAANGPGLAGALLVGLSFAKAVSFASKIDLIGVNHIFGHICANYLNAEGKGGTHVGNSWEPPFICLVVSGGHTHLVEVVDFTTLRVLGRTRDDAAGEAFDKVGRALGLPYPGGPQIDRLARLGDPTAVRFPRAVFDDKKYDFSFSGLKSAVLLHLQKHPVDSDQAVANIAASFQRAVVDVLVYNTIAACAQTGYKKIALAGGVAANGGLREAMIEACRKNGLSLNMPPMLYCTDNAAMIASGAYYRCLNGVRDGYDLNAFPGMGLD